MLQMNFIVAKVSLAWKIVFLFWNSIKTQNTIFFWLNLKFLQIITCRINIFEKKLIISTTKTLGWNFYIFYGILNFKNIHAKDTFALQFDYKGILFKQFHKTHRHRKFMVNKFCRNLQFWINLELQVSQETIWIKRPSRYYVCVKIKIV